MRLVGLLALTVLGATPALAADAPPVAAPAAEPPVCTTVTTVVKRGEVVLSTNSTTRCQDAAHPGGGINPGAVLGGAPEAVLSAPTALLGAVAFGNGDLLTARNTAGDWRVVNSRTGDVCHLTFSVRTTQAGYVARSAGCRGELAQAGAWTYRDGGAEVLKSDGKLIVRLTGRRDLLQGATEGGDALTLQR